MASPPSFSAWTWGGRCWITGARQAPGIKQIFYGEFDGRRPKRVLVKIIGE